MSKPVTRLAASALIRSHRLNLGESQADFADRLGLTERIVQHAEGGGKPHPKNAAPLARELDAKVEELWPDNSDKG